MYIKWGAGDEREQKVRLGFYKSELMDAIAQLVLICESIGVSFEEMKELGMEKAMERFTRKEKK
jgi:NTP pyrophosphatase (non-canonical NTP hydrolase)